jgi:hypothetical protein
MPPASPLVPKRSNGDRAGMQMDVVGRTAFDPAPRAAAIAAEQFARPICVSARALSQGAERSPAAR